MNFELPPLRHCCFIALFALLFSYTTAYSQAGQVLSHQEIADGVGGILPGTLQAGELFGFDITHLGDVDGDGVPDIAVGAPQHDGNFNDDGGVYVLFLNPNGTVKSIQTIAAEQGGFTDPLETVAILGTAVEQIGDFDNDGVRDMVMGAARITDGDGHSNAGAVFVTLMNPNGTVKSHQKLTDGSGGMLGLLAAQSWFGYGVANIGDLDGDGTTDIAVGAPSLDEGYVYILFLNPNGTLKASQKLGEGIGGFTGNLDAGDWWGVDLANIGDLNNDGVTDLLVGSRGEEEVWILFMNSNGTVNFSQQIAQGIGGFTGSLTAGDNFGRGVSNALDIDGDGVNDIFVGARRDDDGDTNRGAVWLLFMNTNGTVKYHQKISDTQGGFTGILENSYEFGSSIGIVGDLNGDGKIEHAVHGAGNGFASNGAVNILFMRTDVVMPVELISFDAIVDADKILVRWETASEENNSGFEVDAYDPAREIWETMGFVDGAGTAQTNQSYEFEINDPSEIYTKFRLKQIDFDGTVSIGNEVEIVRDLPGPYLLSDAYPNPFNPTTNFSLSLALEQNILIDLFDTVGRHVKSLFSGVLAPNTVHNFTINAEGLPGGNYFYRVLGDQFETSKRVVLLK